MTGPNLPGNMPPPAHLNGYTAVPLTSASMASEICALSASRGDGDVRPGAGYFDNPIREQVWHNDRWLEPTCHQTLPVTSATKESGNPLFVVRSGGHGNEHRVRLCSARHSPSSDHPQASSYQRLSRNDAPSAHPSQRRSRRIGVTIGAPAQRGYCFPPRERLWHGDAPGRAHCRRQYMPRSDRSQPTGRRTFDHRCTPILQAHWDDAVTRSLTSLEAAPQAHARRCCSDRGNVIGRSSADRPSINSVAYHRLRVPAGQT